MYQEDDDNESLPIPRRCSLVHRVVNNFGSDNENSPVQQSRLLLNSSNCSDSGVDENIQTPIQLIALYEKTIDLASKNKINAHNAFHFSIVDRLPQVLDVIAFDDRLDFSNDRHEPNFIKVGSIIDTSAKIYGYRVDALHTETQRLNGSINENDDEELNLTNSDEIETAKNPTQRVKTRRNSYIAVDLSTISLSDQFEFHPYQSSNICRWPGGVGIDSLYADMISYTMYSSSDFPMVNGFTNVNSCINTEDDDYEEILDETSNTTWDVNSLRQVIKEHDGQDHILGCQELRNFSFNEDPTVSYIETIDECSLVDNSLDNQEMYIDELSELRNDPSTFCFQELQSAHTFPTTMVSMDVTLLQSKMSFVDQIPQLIRDKSDSSEYSYFDSLKLKLFAGPHLWKYTNLLSDTVSTVQQRASKTKTRYFKLDLLNKKQRRSLEDLMRSNTRTRKSLKKSKRKILSTTLRRTCKYNVHEKNRYQLNLSRKPRPLSDLSSLNFFPDFHLQCSSPIHENDPIDSMDYNDPLSEEIQYDFSRPVQYDKIEYDQNFAKIDAKKLQIQLFDEYHRQSTNTSNPISLSTLCVKLIDQGIISYEKNQIVSTFYCMLNNCNRNQLYMKPNPQNDDLIIQNQPFVTSTQSY